VWPIGNLPAARRATQSGIINGRLYVGGGSIVGSQKYDVWMSSPLDSVLDACPAATWALADKNR